MKKVLFIITGSIAASRCKEIFSLLNIQSYQISCILTEEAKKYVKISDIKKFTKKRIFTDNSEKKNKMLHINLSRNNELILVCPATANSIAKFANGYGDNLASNTLLASNKKIIFVPAMNNLMWQNKANQENVSILKNRGHEFIGPEVGSLKCGEYGLGRISNTDEIIQKIKNSFNHFGLFKNKKCLITAGPTIEMIDPVRYISNLSSGKQGYEIASQLAIHGAKVILISGPTNLDAPPNVKVIKIKSADDMYNKIKKIKNIDIGFFSAAVSDFKNVSIKKKKIKKGNNLKLNLKKNVDILKNISVNNKHRPNLVVGFAAETGSISFAKKKLKTKKCDIIIYNKINKQNQVFGSEYNKISIITKNKSTSLKKMSKVNCAREIIKFIYDYQLENE